MVDLRLQEKFARAAPPVARFNNFYALITVYALSRALVLYMLSRGGYSADIAKYVRWGNGISDTGSFPVGDRQWQYPPLAGAFMAAVTFSTSSRWGFRLVFLVCDALIVVLLARQTKGRRPNNATWTYLLLSILVGPLLLERFDLVPALFAVAAMIWIAKPVRSGLAIAVGASLKLWPLLLIAAHPRRALPKVIAVTAGALIVFNGALWLWSGAAFSFIVNQTNRGLQYESPAALPFALMNAFGAHIRAVSSYGSEQVDSPHAELAGLIVTIAGVAAVALILVWRLLGKLENTPGADVALVLVLVLIATSRIGSPQFMIWAVAVGPVCLLDRKTRMRPILVALGCCCLCSTLIYPRLSPAFFYGDPVATPVQVLRVASLLVATCWGYMRILQAAPDSDAGGTGGIGGSPP